MALTQLKTGAIADDAVTTDKLANAINTERTANTAKSTNATHTGEVTGSGALTITADAVTGAKIADDAVGAEHIEVLDAALQFGDSVKAQFGAGNDLELYHDGTDTHIDNATSNLRIKSNDVQLRDTAENFYIDCNNGGSVDLYHNGSKRLETDANGIHVTTNVHLPDNGVLELGDGSDLQIKHDGSDSFIDDVGTGNLFIRSNHIQINKYTGENMIKCLADGAVSLYHDNTKQCETSANGLSFPAGKGLDFINAADVATGETVASSVLDDYEEGTWTPTFSSTGCTFAYNHQYGYYQKVGNTVHVSFYITLGGGTPLSGTQTNPVRINVPFQATTATRYEAACCFSMIYKFDTYSGNAGDIPLTGRLYSGDDKIDLLAQTDDGANYVYTADRTDQGGCGLAGSITYRVNQ